MKHSLYVMAFASLIAVVACDTVLRVENAGEAYEETRARSGTHTSYCFTCMPGFDGKMDCKMKLSYACPCSYKARVLVQPIKITYEKAGIRDGEKVTELRKETPCQ